MKFWMLALLWLLTACDDFTQAKIAVDCGHFNNQGLQVSVNSLPLSTCPATVPAGATQLRVSARKELADGSYLYAEQEVAVNAMQMQVRLEPHPVLTEEYYYRKATDVYGFMEYQNHYPKGARIRELWIRFAEEFAKVYTYAPNLMMVQIPAGSFMMGCSDGDTECDDNEKPQHRVTLKGFKLSQTEITLAQYYKFAQETQREIIQSIEPDRIKDPISFVTYDDAVAYTTWLSQKLGQSFFLPSEAQWEYAARAGSTTKYSWGNTADCNRASFDGGPQSECSLMLANGEERKRAAVGRYPANAFGLQDMHGSVWEWVQDCLNDSYENAPNDGSPWLTGNCKWRMSRGGAWSSSGRYVRSSIRSVDDPDSSLRNFGFRVASY